MQIKRVVVTGMGALTPIGNNLEAYWEGLKTGKSGCAPITYFDTEKFKTKFACELKGYKPEDYFDRKEARKLHEILHKFYLSFKGYFDIKAYAKKKGVSIINLTKGSFIDAFEKKPLSSFINKD